MFKLPIFIKVIKSYIGVNVVFKFYFSGKKYWINILTKICLISFAYFASLDISDMLISNFETQNSISYSNLALPNSIFSAY